MRSLSMEGKAVYVLLFAFIFESYANCGKPVYNPCVHYPCSGESLCWYDENRIPHCENACDYTRCDGNHYCVNEVGLCGDSSCKPVGKCHSKEPPNPCTGITCPGGEQCTVVVPLSGGPTPICGQNPCIGHKCCDKSDGGVCENDGCYLERIEFSCRPGQACQVIPVCRNPCRIQQVQCKEPGAFCYTSKAICIWAPCNPIPECRKPCDTSIVNVCDEGQKCEIIWVNCVSDPNSPFYDPYCKPKEICTPVLSIST